MKFKITKPEDYAEVEGIGYKTIHAYSKVSFDLTMLLIKVDSAINVYEESKRSKDDLEWMLDFLKRTIKEFEVPED